MPDVKGQPGVVADIDHFRAANWVIPKAFHALPKDGSVCQALVFIHVQPGTLLGCFSPVVMDHRGSLVKGQDVVGVSSLTSRRWRYRFHGA